MSWKIPSIMSIILAINLALAEALIQYRIVYNLLCHHAMEEVNNTINLFFLSAFQTTDLFKKWNIQDCT